MNYNKVYENLVESNNDIVGLVSYSLYKEYKRDQFLKIKQSKNRVPNKNECQQIEDFALNNITEYRQKANDLLDISFEQLIENYKSTVYENFYKEYGIGSFKEDLEIIKKNSKPKPFYKELLVEISGNIAWLVLVLSASILLFFNSGGVKRLKNKIIETIEEPTITDTTKKITIKSENSVTQKK